MPAPDHMLEVGSGSHAAADGADDGAAGAGPARRSGPTWSSSPATSTRPWRAALTAAKMRDPRRPRRVRPAQLRPHDARGGQPDRHRPLSDLLFLHSDEAIDNLRAEGIRRRAHALRRQHDDRHPGRAGGPLPRRRRGAPARRRRPASTCSSRCTAPRSSTGRCSADDRWRAGRLAARCRSSSRSIPRTRKMLGGDRARAPGPAAARPARLPRLPLAAGRRRAPSSPTPAASRRRRPTSASPASPCATTPSARSPSAPAPTPCSASTRAHRRDPGGARRPRRAPDPTLPALGRPGRRAGGGCAR